MPKFSGGVSINSNGYLVIKAGPHRDKYVHIMVAEAMLGRELRPDEDVEHRDADKLNPHWSNLVVLGKSEHGAVSNRQKWFLKNREESERKAWQEWIWNGGDTPDGSAAQEGVFHGKRRAD